MTRPIRRAAFALLVPLTAFAFASGALAKSKAPVDPKAACQKDVEKKLKMKHPYAKGIQLTVSREWQQSSTQSGVGGTGTYTASDKKPGNFEWTCVYDTTNNKVLDANIEKPSKSAPATTPATK